MSPEICKDLPYSYSSDVWSLGVILYELCTLRHPFAGKDLGSLFRSIVTGKYSPISSMYSADLRALVAEMLQVNPDKRPTVNDILRRPFLQHRATTMLPDDIYAEEFAHTVLHKQNILKDTDVHDATVLRKQIVETEREQAVCLHVNDIIDVLIVAKGIGTCWN